MYEKENGPAGNLPANACLILLANAGILPANAELARGHTVWTFITRRAFGRDAIVKKNPPPCAAPKLLLSPTPPT